MIDLTSSVGVRERLYVQLDEHRRQIAELEAENKRLREAIEKTLDYWRRNSPTNLQYDKLGDYIRLLEESLGTRQSKMEFGN